jgi:23S rRNA pseudouridine1911/1915/1917 synthase
VVAEADHGRRLDQVLAANVPDLSRRKARAALDIGGVFVDGARTKVAGRVMRAGQSVVVNLGGALERADKDVGKAARERDEARLPPFRVVHEDPDIVVVDKPAGLLTAPTPESDRNNLASLLAQRMGHVFVVHRLDLETSGLLVFARTEEANRVLSERFREHDVERAYLAVLRGQLAGDTHVVEAPIAGRRALTHVDVLARSEGDPGATFVRCRLFTGRTHQIRLHARELGHPVLGDRRYGEVTSNDPPRMALHAAVLGIRHPASLAELRFESPWPADLAAWLDALTLGRDERET